MGHGGAAGEGARKPLASVLDSMGTEDYRGAVLARHRRMRELRWEVGDRRLETAFGSWRQVSAGAKLLRRHAVRVLVTRRAQRLVRCHLTAWHTTIFERQYAVACATEHHGFCAMRRAWDGWVAVQARQRLVNYRLATHLLGRWSYRRLTAAIDGWVDFACARKQKWLAGQHMRRFIIRRSAQRAFRAWRIEGASQIHLIKAMNLRLLFRSWRQVAVQASTYRAKLQKRMARLLVHRAENIVRTAVIGWHNVVAKSNATRADRVRTEKIGRAHV